MRRSSSRWLVLLAVILAASSCTSAERRSEWGYRFEPALLERAPVQLVAQLQEGCESGAPVLARWPVGAGAMPSEQRSDRGALALALRAVAPDGVCSVYASGCAVLGEGRTEVVLRATPAQALCPGDSICARLDCAPPDAGAPPDASTPAMPDAGGGTDGDAGRDASVEREDAGPEPDAGAPTPCERLRADGAVWTCEDFERSFDLTTTIEVRGTGRAQVSTDAARTGARGMRLRVSSRDDVAFFRLQAVDPSAREIWLRAWVSFSAVSWQHDFTYLFGGSGGYGIATVLSQSRELGVWFGAEVGEGRDGWRGWDGRGGYPAGWTCVELHTIVDAASGRFDAYADGMLLRSLAASTASPDGPYTELLFGYVKQQPSGEGVMFVDDLAIGPARLPCP